MDEKNTNIIGENIRSYRNKAGLSLRDIGEKLNLSHMAIQKYEQGRVLPDTSMIIKLADILQVPVEKILFERPKVHLDRQAFRKRKIKPSIADRLQDDISFHIANYLQAESYIDNKDIIKAQSKHRIFSIKKDGDCEEIASKVRSLLNLGDNCIDNLIHLLEDWGFLVILLQGYKKIDGVSGFYNDIPIIVLSEIGAGDRMRFTTAHELGHLYINMEEEQDEKEVEKQMDCFASAFLMPRRVILDYFCNKRDKVSLKEVYDFKMRNKVSMQAIIRRLYAVGVISENEKNRLLQQMYKNGMSINEPGKVAPEIPNLMRRIVSQLVTEEIISVSKGAQLLDINVKDFVENALLDS
jgi:Zn-dependent peptidase ImmA (M78 family)/DNA-binding XRE family transcriptional regulator